MRHGLLRWWQRSKGAMVPPYPRQVRGRGEVVSLFIGWRADNRHSQDDMRRRKTERRREVLAIGANGRPGRRRAEMPGKSIAETHRAGHGGGRPARGEYPDWRQRHVIGDHPNARERMSEGVRMRGQRLELTQLFRELLRVERP